jgi:hypothetical protein
MDTPARLPCRAGWKNTLSRSRGVSSNAVLLIHNIPRAGVTRIFFKARRERAHGGAAMENAERAGHYALSARQDSAPAQSVTAPLLAVATVFAYLESTPRV